MSIANSQWTYARDRDRAFTEYGEWAGDRVPILRRHFHLESQLALVMMGRRAFCVGSEVYSVEAGQFLYIPPGQPHQGIALEEQSSRCINAYFAGPDLGSLPFVAEICETLKSSSEPQDVLRALARQVLPLPSLSFSSQGAPAHALGAMESPIMEIAALHGVSREHFTRRFTRDVGISPHSYRLMRRLDEGRRRLRTGEPIADIAADLMFADQSHFGRLFRQAFGATPRSYLEGMR